MEHSVVRGRTHGSLLQVLELLVGAVDDVLLALTAGQTEYCLGKVDTDAFRVQHSREELLAEPWVGPLRLGEGTAESLYSGQVLLIRLKLWG